MSSRVVVNTLKFCTTSMDILVQALNVLQLPIIQHTNAIIVNGKQIEVQNNVMFMRFRSDDSTTPNLFNRINSKVAEIESQLRAIQAEKNAILQSEARATEEMYRVRQIQKEQDRLAYEQKQLKLEQESFVQAKKEAIIQKAKAMGYSVQERVENGTVKLKLIKRIY